MPTYRLLHRPTVEQWLARLRNETEANRLRPTQRAIVLVSLATASLFNFNEVKAKSAADEESMLAAEQFFQHSQRILVAESGRAILEVRLSHKQVNETD
jgi:hypothetical protein